MLRWFRYAAAAGVLLAFAPAHAQEQIDVRFEQFTLENGLNVILHRDASTPIITTNVWYHVGSAHERPGRTGFAHFFEHLMFEGSANVPRGRIDQWFEEVGGSPNGSTSRDRTNYYQTFSSNALDLALFIESDRMAYLMEAMSPELIEIQRSVVQQERRQSYDNRPYGLAFQTLAEEMYDEEFPYSWPVIGYMDDLRAATFQDVGDFFERYYAPNNASLVISGGIDYDEARALVEKWFSEIPPGAPVPEREAHAPRIGDTRRVMIEDRVQLPRLYLGWITPAAYEDGDAEMTALAEVLAGGRNSRLYRRLVYEMEIADDVSAFQRSGKLASDFVIMATARSGHTLEELERIVMEEIDRLLSEPPTTGELDRVRNQYEVSFLESLERVDRKADQLNEYFFYVGEPGFFGEDLQRFRALTPASLRDAAGRYLTRDERVVLSIVPEGRLELATPGSRLVPSDNLENSPAAR